MMSILLWLLFGALVGWAAGIIMNTQSSLLGNIIFGIIGSIVGGYVASQLGFGSLGGGFNFDPVNIAIAIGGACIVIFVAGFFRRKR